MLFNKFIGLTVSALLTIGNGFIHPAITWINNSSLNITVGSSVNYYFDIEYNEWYPSSGSVDTAGTGRCDTNIIIGNGTDPMTGFIQYDRSALTRGTNLISYDDNVAVTNNMIYFYNVSSFTLTTFFSTDIGDLNQPTFTVTFIDGYIWDERDDSDLYALMNLMLGDISAIKQNETNVYNSVVAMGTQLGLVKSSIDAMALNIVSIDSKLDNIVSYLSTINGNINRIYSLINKIKNYQIPIYSYEFYYALTSSYPNNTYNFDSSYEFANLGVYPSIKWAGYTIRKSHLYVNKDIPYIYVYLDMSNGTYLRPRYYSTMEDIPVSLNSDGRTIKRVVGSFTPASDSYIYFYNSSTIDEIVPIYFGPLSKVPDEVASYFGIDKYADNTSDLENARDDFVTQSNQLIEFENAQNENMQQQLQNINFNFDGSQFNESASFYKRVFTDFVGSTPLFTPLAVILTFCLAMILLGAL